MRRLATMLLVLLVLTSWVRDVTAETLVLCAPRWLVLNTLVRGHGEAVFVSGITPGGHLLEFLLNIKTGTWSVVVSTPGGPSCIWATGIARASIKPVKEEGA